MTLKPWRRVATEPLRDCRVFEVERVIARSPRTDAFHDFYRLHSADWVNVVALTPRAELVLVRQYRHGSGSLTLEIPGGMIDPGEAPAVAAARELLEETGYEASRVIPVGAVNPNPALFTNRVHTFLAPDVVRTGDIVNEGAEETEVALVPAADVHALVRRGAIDHALVLAGLYQWEIERAAGTSS